MNSKQIQEIEKTIAIRERQNWVKSGSVEYWVSICKELLKEVKHLKAVIERIRGEE